MTDSVCSQKSPVPTLCAGLFINHETSEVYLHLNVWPFRLPLLWPRLIFHQGDPSPCDVGSLAAP